jgi:hypothetical protein
MSQTVNQYDVVTITWSPPSGNGATVVVTAPDATTITLGVSSGSAFPNTYTAYFSAEQSGAYSVHWAAIGSSAVFDDTVTSTAYSTVQLLTIQDCYQSLDIPASRLNQDAARDADMLIYALAATRVVEGIVGPLRRLLKSETFDGGDTTVVLTFKPTSILGVYENGVLIADWVPDFRGATIKAGTTWHDRPFWPGTQNVTVKYWAGSGNVSPNALLAVREEFRLLWEQGRQGGHAEFNQQIIAAQAVPMGYAVPYRIIEMLAQEPTLPGFA